MVFLVAELEVEESSLRCHARVCKECGSVAIIRSYYGARSAREAFWSQASAARRHFSAVCSQCSHYVETIPSEWEADQAAALSSIDARFRREPSRLAYGIEALEVLYEYGDDAMGDAIADHLERAFPQEPAALEAAMDWFGAVARFDRALPILARLDALPSAKDPHAVADARRRLGLMALAHGSVAIGVPLLLTLTEPDADDFGPLVRAGYRLHIDAEYRQAYTVFAYLLRHFPERAKKTSILETISALEKSLRVNTSVLPRGWKTKGHRVVATIMVLGLVAFAVGIDTIVRGHQQVFLCNGTAQPGVVELGPHRYTVGPGKVVLVRLPEGDHTATVLIAGLERSELLPVHNTLVERWRSKNTFVFDLLGGSALVRGRLLKSKAPISESAGGLDILGGRSFYSLKDIELPFQPPFPDSDLLAIALYASRDTPESVAAAVMASPGDFPDFHLHPFAHAHLLTGRRSQTLVKAYLHAAPSPEAREHAVRWLAATGISTAD